MLLCFPLPHQKVVLKQKVHMYIFVLLLYLSVFQLITCLVFKLATLFNNLSLKCKHSCSVISCCIILIAIMGATLLSMRGQSHKVEDSRNSWLLLLTIDLLLNYFNFAISDTMPCGQYDRKCKNYINHL